MSEKAEEILQKQLEKAKDTKEEKEVFSMKKGFYFWIFMSYCPWTNISIFIYSPSLFNSPSNICLLLCKLLI